MKINLEHEQINSIVVSDLKQLLEHFEENLREDNPCIFSREPEYDRSLIEEHIRATKLILKWYS